MDKEKEKQEWLSGIMTEAVRFGSAIGSWLDTKQLWQNFAAHECIKIIQEAASREALQRLNEIDNDLCFQCGQKKPPETVT